MEGIDASSAMIAKLRAKPGGTELVVHEGSFAEFELAGRYSLIYVVFNTFFALLKFANGAVGNLLFSWAGHGEATGFDGGGALYGSGGAIKGNRLLVDGAPEREVVKAFSEEADPAERDRFFPRGVTDGFALELLEFLNAIEEGRQPETSGEEGLRDMAPCMAILESSQLGGAPVKVADVETCRVEEYQNEINAHWGIE